MLCKIDSNGYIINSASKDKIQTEYLSIINQLIRTCKNILKTNFCSFYVRGSVSVGEAIPYISDLDCIVITKHSAKNVDLQLIYQTVKKLEKQNPFVTIIDLMIIELEKLLQSQKYPNLPIFLKIQSVCIDGKDIVDKIPKVKANTDLVRRLYANLDQEFRKLRDKFNHKSQDKKYLGQDRTNEFWFIWTMRILIRSSLGIVMLDKSIYTHNLVECHHEFVNRYPEFKLCMDKALAYSLKPLKDQAAILDFFDQCITPYIKFWNKKLKQNN